MGASFNSLHFFFVELINKESGLSEKEVTNTLPW